MELSTQDNSRIVRGRWQGWALVAVVCGAIVLWGLLNYRLVGDRPRAWDFGVFPDAPGESVYSTVRPPPARNVSRQTPVLPEADTRPTSVPREAQP